MYQIPYLPWPNPAYQQIRIMTSLRLLQACCRPHSVLTKTASRGSMSGASQATSPAEERGPPSGPPPGPAPVLGAYPPIGSMSSMGSIGSSIGATTGADVTKSDSHGQLVRRDSQGR